ncbi:hypothetical protein A5714_15565 [Mycobacterium sp. E2462]|nr:hypothetical protein A5714_15565 [Mycobacterium sp. E2462]
MVVICGKSTPMARAAQMVLTCSRSSGATPWGSGNWNCWPPAGGAPARAARACASSGVAVRGALGGAGAAAGTDVALDGAAAGGSMWRGFAPWA